MARGALAAGGGLNAADLVADALEAAGTPSRGSPRRGRSTSAAARAAWCACWGPHGPTSSGTAATPTPPRSPGPPSTSPASRSTRAGQEPPLPFEDASFGLVYAISVWSHLSAEAALRWFAEMRRIVAPGGLLVPTVQSWQTTRHLAASRLWELRDIREAVADMYADGHHFRRTFGPEGDYGVAGSDWGFATLSAEWLLRALTPDWQVLLWRTGAHERDQDVVVLRRRLALDALDPVPLAGRTAGARVPRAHAHERSRARSRSSTSGPSSPL